MGDEAGGRRVLWSGVACVAIGITHTTGVCRSGFQFELHICIKSAGPDHWWNLPEECLRGQGPRAMRRACLHVSKAGAQPPVRWEGGGGREEFFLQSLKPGCYYRKKLGFSLACRKTIVHYTILSANDDCDILHRHASPSSINPVAVYYSAPRFITGDAFNSQH